MAEEWEEFNPQPAAANSAANEWAQFNPQPAERPSAGTTIGGLGPLMRSAAYGLKKAVVGQNEFDYPEIHQGHLLETNFPLVVKLNRTRGEQGQLDVLRAADPKMPAPTKDKYGNIIVQFEGRPYYLNRSGFSDRDMMEGVRDTLLMGPAARVAGAVTAGAILPLRAAAQAAAGAVGSLVTDVVSGLSGSKQGLDLPGMIGSIIGGAGGEMLGSAGTAVVQKIKTNPARYMDRNGDLTDEGVRMFAEAGFDPVDISRQVAAEFTRQARRTGGTTATVREAAANEFGIPLTRGQATQNYSDIAFEQSARADARGQTAGEIVRGQFQRQDEAIAKAKADIAYDLAPNVGAESPQRSAGYVQTGLRQQERAHGEMVNAAWDQAGEQSKGVFVPRESLQALPDVVKGALRDKNLRVTGSGQLFPAAAAAMELIEDIGALKVSDATTKSGSPMGPLGLALQAVDMYRKELGGRGGFGEAAAMPADRLRMRTINRAFNDWLDGVVDAELMKGGKDGVAAVQQFKNARAASKKHFDLFEERMLPSGQPDDAGKAIERMIQFDVTEQEVANLLYGTSKVGDSGRAYRIAKRVQEIVGKDSVEWQALRKGMWQRMTLEAEGVDQPGAQAVSKNIMEFTNGKGQALAQALFSPAELAKMRRFAQVMKSTVPPPGSRNYSASGYELARIMGGMSYQVAPLYIRIFDQTRNVSSTARALTTRGGAPVARPGVPPAVPAASAAAGGLLADEE